MSQSKIVSVPGNGQVCIGKKYAGRDAKLEFISENKIIVTFGQFIPDDQAAFFTEESKKKLADFGEYEKTPPSENSVKKLKASTNGKKQKEKK